MGIGRSGRPVFALRLAEIVADVHVRRFCGPERTDPRHRAGWATKLEQPPRCIRWPLAGRRESLHMTDCSACCPAASNVRIVRAKSFEGYVVMEGDRVVAVALSEAEAEEIIRRLALPEEPPRRN